MSADLWPDETGVIGEVFATPEQQKALEMMRACGQRDLAAKLGPAGAAEWIELGRAVFADLSRDSLRRLAAGEDPESVVGSERAALMDEMGERAKRLAASVGVHLD